MGNLSYLYTGNLSSTYAREKMLEEYINEEKRRGKAMNCFKCGNPVPETDKLWASTGMCETCRNQEQARDEAKFWENKVMSQLDQIVREIAEINKTLKDALK